MGNTADAMVGYEEEIINYFGLPPITNKNHFNGPCPLCHSKKSFRLHFYHSNLLYICKCGSGNLMQLVLEVTGLDFQDAARQIDEITGRVYNKPANIPAKTKKDSFLEKYNKLLPVRGSPVEQYLNSRGIYDLPSNSVRYSPIEYDKQHKLDFETMYSVVSNERHEACYIHKTYLKGGQKANVSPCKKLATIKESHGSVAIKLFEASTALGIAEGIESALAAKQIYKCPVWSVVSTSFMARFKAPSGVEHLIIFCDNDLSGAGLAAGFACGHKNILANNDVTRVSLRWPSNYGEDFNDVLIGGSSVLEWSLKKK